MTSITDGTAYNGTVSLATRDYGGDGPDLLFLPGAGQTLADFDHLAPLLTSRHRVAATDLRGHGYSGDGEFTWEAVLDDLEAVTAALGMHEPAVAGHSLGGMVAAQYGARHPELPGVINIDGHGSGRASQYDGVPEEVFAVREAELRTLRAAQLDAAMPEVVPTELVETIVAQYVTVRGFEPDFARQLIARGTVAVDGGFRYRVTRPTITAILDLVEQLDLAAVYRACAAPLLVYNAVRADPAATASGPEWLADHQAAYRRGLSLQLAELSDELPLLSWIEIDATHSLIYEEPQVIASQLIDFLTVDRATATSSAAVR